MAETETKVRAVRGEVVDWDGHPDFRDSGSIEVHVFSVNGAEYRLGEK